MKRLNLIAMLLTLLGTYPLGAAAQTIYRCGDSYSQKPCPGGQTIQAADERTQAQKAQTDAAIQRDSRTAATLEKNRLQQEATQARATTAAQHNAPQAAASNEPVKKSTASKKSRNPEYFTARDATEKKKKSSSGALPASSP
jgi:phage repressor protein C with HTH and peptisase S24 domain